VADSAGVSQISGGIQNMIGGDRYPCEGFRRLEGPLCPAYERISYAFSFVQGGFVMMRGLGIEFKEGIERHSLVRMASCGLFKLKALTEKNYLQ
jgi:hypothetical protein